MLLLFFILFHLLSCRLNFIFFKIKYIYIHAYIYCLITNIFNFIFLYNINVSPFSYNIYNLLKENEYKYIHNYQFNNYYLLIILYNTNGYMIADTLDFLIFDNKNLTRKKYFLHHLISIVAISISIFYNRISCFVAIYYLEIGGLVHHIRILSNKYNKFFTLATLLYIVIYSLTRILFFKDVTLFLLYNLKEKNIVEFINIFISYTLIIQNVFWLITNIKKIFKNNF